MLCSWCWSQPRMNSAAASVSLTLTVAAKAISPFPSSTTAADASDPIQAPGSPKKVAMASGRMLSPSPANPPPPSSPSS